MTHPLHARIRFWLGAHAGTIGWRYGVGHRWWAPIRMWTLAEAARSRVGIAILVAWDALRGDHRVQEALGYADHPDLMERYTRVRNERSELLRLRAALAEEPKPNLREQLGALRLRVEAQARELTTMREAAERRNRDLAALHIVWCDGGCPGGVGNREALDKATVLAAVRNTARLVRWWNNAAYRKGSEVYASERVAASGLGVPEPPPLAPDGKAG